MNFDGASHGNPSPTGYGGVFRNDAGEIIFVYAGSLGTDTNNATELWELIRGIQWAITHKISKLVVQGDSWIIIQIIRKMHNGTVTHKVSRNWCFSSNLTLPQKEIKNIPGLITSHVLQEANRVADRLSNEGINQNQIEFCEHVEQLPNQCLKKDCLSLAYIDVPPLYGVLG
jgi:ribonuclease HI